MKKVMVGFAVGLAVVLAVGVLGFRREYVLPAYSLIGTSATAGTSAVIVSGSLYPSGAKVSKVTTSDSDGRVLIRVYAAAIGESDSARTSGVFRVVIPLNGQLHEIAIGDGARFMTVGSFCGWPIRVPRLHAKASAYAVVWQHP
jgi:hypothetical protein